MPSSCRSPLFAIRLPDEGNHAPDEVEERNNEKKLDERVYDLLLHALEKRDLDGSSVCGGGKKSEERLHECLELVAALAVDDRRSRKHASAAALHVES